MSQSCSLRRTSLTSSAGWASTGILIDCEHGSISLESVELMVMAAETAGVTPIARPSANSFELIGQLMDRGVMGVQVPHVNTAEDAQRAVEAVKYHPIGERGLAAGVRSASYGYGISMSEYAEQSNRDTLVCVQLEEAEAVKNVDQIVGVEGVDVFFVGPSDLSQSLGYPGRPDAPEVREAMDTVFATIAAAGEFLVLRATPMHTTIPRPRRHLPLYAPYYAAFVRCWDVSW